MKRRQVDEYSLGAAMKQFRTLNIFGLFLIAEDAGLRSEKSSAVCIATGEIPANQRSALDPVHQNHLGREDALSDISSDVM